MGVQYRQAPARIRGLLADFSTFSAFVSLGLPLRVHLHIDHHLQPGGASARDAHRNSVRFLPADFDSSFTEELQVC